MIGAAVAFLLGALTLLAAGIAVDAWPAPPPEIRVHLTSGTCVPCWSLRMTRADSGEWTTLCAYRMKDGGYNFTGWPLSAIAFTEAVADAAGLMPGECAPKWTPEATR